MLWWTQDCWHKAVTSNYPKAKCPKKSKCKSLAAGSCHQTGRRNSEEKTCVRASMFHGRYGPSISYSCDNMSANVAQALLLKQNNL